MNATVESYKSEIARVRTGRASTNLISGVMVDYYGMSTPLNQLATLNVPEPQLIIVQPFDINSLGDIEKAIQSAELGLNPSNDGKIIRVPVPALTEERRKEMVRLLKKMTEEHKVAIRNIRRDGNDDMKNLEKKQRDYRGRPQERAGRCAKADRSIRLRIGRLAFSQRERDS